MASPKKSEKIQYDKLGLLAKKQELSLELKEKTKELKNVHDMLINTCNVQKETMEYCLENIDDENDYKEEIQITKHKLGNLLMRYYVLMYNDAIRTFREVNEIKINSHILLDRLLELRWHKSNLHRENQELEKQINELDRTRGEFKKESDDLTIEINYLKERIHIIDVDLVKAGIETECDTCRRNKLLKAAEKTLS
uniref:Takusan domain-containing protein n=1 Tax=Caenorhabditis tropicalis TaxID=1561998 RepID=A0A1I7U0U9_9PELO